MCSIEQALPYVALAVLCPGAYEGMLREKVAGLFGASSAVARPHGDPSSDEQDEQEAEA